MKLELSANDLTVAKQSVFFGSLPDDVFTGVAQQSKVIGLNGGQTLFSMGEPAKSVFVVLDGLIKLSVTSQDGEDIVVEIFHAGMSFAEALMFKKAFYPVTATALLQSRVLGAPHAVVEQQISATPDAFGAILGSTYVHLHKLVQQIEQLKSNSGTQRVARYVLALANASPNANAFDLPFEKQVLASFLGIKPETLSRAFRRLGDYGVTLDGAQVFLEDPRALHELLEKSTTH